MSSSTIRAVVVYDDPRQTPPPEEWQRHHESLIGRCLRGVVRRVTPETLRVELKVGSHGAYPVTVPWDRVGRTLPDLNEHFHVDEDVAVRLVSVDQNRVFPAYRMSDCRRAVASGDMACGKFHLTVA